MKKAGTFGKKSDKPESLKENSNQQPIPYSFVDKSILKIIHSFNEQRKVLKLHVKLFDQNSQNKQRTLAVLHSPGLLRVTYASKSKIITPWLVYQILEYIEQGMPRSSTLKV